MLARHSAFAVICVLLHACSVERTAPAHVQVNISVGQDTPDTLLHLVGQGTFATDQQAATGLNGAPGVVLNAVRRADGAVIGVVLTPITGPSDQAVLFGEVTELVPPSGTNPYWCVSVPWSEQPTFVALVYIRDSGDGQSSFDEIAAEGDFGASCAQYPTPNFGTYSLSKGDFKGMVRIR
jgi:hypothetical protein